MPESRCLIIEQASKRRSVADWDEEEDGAVIGSRLIWQWEGIDEELNEDVDEDLITESDVNDYSNDVGQLTYSERPQIREADGLIFIQMDEVKIDAQPISGRKELLIYTAVVNADGKKYY